MRSTRGWISRNLLVLIIGGSVVLHFLVPKFYQRIVPRALGHQEEIVAISGAAEIGCAALMVLPRTRRIGGWLTSAPLLALLPADFQQAFDGKPYHRTGVPSSPAFVLWRLPLLGPPVPVGLGVVAGRPGGGR